MNIGLDYYIRLYHFIVHLFQKISKLFLNLHLPQMQMQPSREKC
jgi:hypothetical protein